MMKNTQRFFLLISALIGLLVAGCGANTQTTTTSNTPLRVGSNYWPSFGPVYIAAEKGLFEKAGLTVEVVSYESYDQSTADLATKKLDGNLMVYSDGIAQVAAGIPIQLVWVLDNSAGSDTFVARRGIENPTDLKGKRIGYSSGTFGQLFVTRGLANYGLTEADVNVVNISAEDIPAAIAAGEIDAGHTWEPFLSEVLKAEGKVLFTSSETPGVIADTIFFQSSVIEKRSEEVQTFIRVLNEMRQWWLDNPEEGDAIVAKALNMSIDDFKTFIAGLKVFTLQDNLNAFDQAYQGSESLYESGQFAIDQFVEKSVITNAPDLNTIINPMFVQALAKS